MPRAPFSKAIDTVRVPIRTSHAGRNGEADFTFSYWMREFERNPSNRYVSDGDPAAITIPADAAADVKPRFRTRVRPSP